MFMIIEKNNTILVLKILLDIILLLLIEKLRTVDGLFTSAL